MVTFMRRLVSLLLAAVLLGSFAAAEEGSRKLRAQVKPVYPELAKRMRVSGVVKLQVTIAPSGTVTTVKPIGGHPLLIDAAADAAKRCRFDSGPSETSQVLEFRFEPGM